MHNDNERFLNFLLTDLKGPVTLFLGAGSSMEGIDRNGEPFPSFEYIQKQIINRYGNDIQKEKANDENQKNVFEIFLEVNKELRSGKMVNSVLLEYLKGKPGYAHYQLAASVFSFKDSLYLTLTPNYDNLFNHAVDRLSCHSNSIFQSYTPEIIEDKDISSIVREYPIIIKLFGDLGVHENLFDPRELDWQIYNLTKHEYFKSSLKYPILFIGYSFSDRLYEDLFGADGNTVYIVNPNEIKLETKRKCMQFFGTFGEFMGAFLDKLEEDHIDIFENVKNLLSKIDPNDKFHRLAEVIPIMLSMNKRGKGIVEDRFLIKKGDQARKKFLITRKEATKWVEEFCKSDFPLMLILGESGFGKSCFLYNISNKQDDNTIVSFFAGSALINTSGLLGRICQEFGSNIDHAKSLFSHIDKLLGKEPQKKQWLIIVDGINESPDYHYLFEDIIKIGEWNFPNIKVLYSCRAISWENNYLANDCLRNMHFSGWSCIIENFTSEERELAYESYRSILDIPTAYDDIDDSVKQHMTNPLMMRMIVLSYPGEKLMEYVPNTAVFDNYWKFLEDKSKKDNNSLDMNVLLSLAKYKIAHFAASNINNSDLFYLRDHLGDLLINEKNILPWQDEGVLVWVDNKEKSFRFSFDRFYEYILSLILIDDFRNNKINNPVTWVNLTLKEYSEQQAHFSYTEALKVFLIHQGLQKRDLDLQSLINQISEGTYRNFAIQVLRELIFETDQPVMEAFDSVISVAPEENIDIYKEAQLTIAANSSKIIVSAIRGIFSGDDKLAHRCIQLLCTLSPEDKNVFTEDVRAFLADLDSLSENSSKGFLYLYVLYFCWQLRCNSTIDLSDVSRDYFDLIQTFSNHKDTLMSSFVNLIKRWGSHFFSTTSRGSEDPLNYPWKRMGTPERAYALRLSKAIGKEFSALNSDDIEAIRFFSLETPKVDEITSPRPSGIPHKYPIESMLGQWVLIRHGKSNFNEIIKMLDVFMKTQDFCTSDYCICILSEILNFHYQPCDIEYGQGFQQLVKWVDYFCENDDFFFDVLNRQDPYSDTYNPLCNTASIFGKLNPDKPSNQYLDKWTNSEDIRRKKLGLFAARRLWRRYGIQVLNSVSCLFDIDEKDTYIWLNYLMKEVSLINRNLFEQYRATLNLSAERLQEIESTKTVLASTENYSIEPVLSLLFNSGLSNVRIIQEWHSTIYSCDSLDDFLKKLSTHLYEWQKDEYLNSNSTFCNP